MKVQVLMAGRVVVAALAVMAAVVLVLTGCATGSGSLAGDVISVDTSERDQDDGQEQSAEKEDRDDDGDDEEPRDTLVVSTSPVDAVVFLDDRYMGEAPLSLATLEPGRYTVRVEAEGYVTVTQRITVDEGSRVEISIELQPITGRLELTGDVENAVVRIDGSAASSIAVDIEDDVYELPIGRYAVQVSRFGYEDFQTTVTVREMQTTAVAVDLEPLDFEITSISLSRERFSPANAGAIGTTAVRFAITTPGRGTLRVEAQDGTVVHEERLGSMNQPGQRAVWDGTVTPGGGTGGGDSRVAPDGTYFMVVQGVGDGFDGADEASVAVTIDSSLVIRYRGNLSGVGGLAYAATPDVLPAGSWQIAATALGHRAVVDGAAALRVPAFGALRVGAPGNVEIAAQGGATFITGSTPRWFATASMKKQLIGGPDPGSGFPFSAAVALRGTAKAADADGSIDGPDTLTSFPGVSLSVPLALGRRASLMVVPEIMLSPGQVTYDPDDAGTAGAAGWDAWMYGRIGTMYETPAWSIGVSAAVRTTPFGRTFGIDLPLAAALEGHVVVPGTSLFLSGMVATEARDFDDFYVVGGGSIGFLF